VVFEKGRPALIPSRLPLGSFRHVPANPSVARSGCPA
jgi:hypothetical protein